MSPWSPYRQRVMLTDLTDHHIAGTERQLKPNSSPHYLAAEAEKQQLQDTSQIYPLSPE